jgi:hypothetical protein
MYFYLLQLTALAPTSAIACSPHDCTLPALSPGSTYFHSTGDSVNPVRRSSTRRVSCDCTISMSMSTGLAKDFKMASLVISWNTALYL